MAAAVKGISASPKSPWYGTYVRKLSVSKDCGINVLELYPFSEGNGTWLSMYLYSKMFRGSAIIRCIGNEIISGKKKKKEVSSCS